MVWRRVVKRFDNADVQVWLIEKIWCGRLDEDYLDWNGRTR